MLFRDLMVGSNDFPVGRRIRCFRGGRFAASGSEQHQCGSQNCVSFTRSP